MGNTRKHRPCIAAIHGLKAVTPNTIAYIACLVCDKLCFALALTILKVRFTMSKAESWSVQDDAFNYEIFFNSILELFYIEDDLLKEWAEETLDWWNQYDSVLFGTNIRLTCI